MLYRQGANAYPGDQSANDPHPGSLNLVPPGPGGTPFNFSEWFQQVHPAPTPAPVNTLFVPEETSEDVETDTDSTAEDEPTEDTEADEIDEISSDEDIYHDLRQPNVSARKKLYYECSPGQVSTSTECPPSMLYRHFSCLTNAVFERHHRSPRRLY